MVINKCNHIRNNAYTCGMDKYTMVKGYGCLVPEVGRVVEDLLEEEGGYWGAVRIVEGRRLMAFTGWGKRYWEGVLEELKGMVVVNKNHNGGR
jgi:hypothetical protein